MGGYIMSEEINETKERVIEGEPFIATPLPHAWLPMLSGFGIFLALLIVFALLMGKYLNSRPYDMIAISEQTAQSVELFLRNHQVSPEQVAKVDPIKSPSSKAHYYQHAYTIHLSPGVKAATMERQLGQKMMNNDFTVQDYIESDERKGITIALGTFPIVTVEFVEARSPRRYAQTPSATLATLSSGQEEGDSIISLPTLNRNALPEKVTPAAKPASLSTPPSSKESTYTGWRPKSKQAPATAPKDVDDDIQLARVPFPEQASPKSLLPPEATPSTVMPKAKLVIIVDDGGYGGDLTDIILSLNPKLTLSILPNTPYTKLVAEKGHEKGFEIMLHMPMENTNPETQHPGQINIDMNESQIQALTEDALKQVPHAIGINNHTGSKFTTDAKAMALFINTIKDKDVFFIDSKTAVDTKAYDIAMAFGVPSAERSLFIDNPQETTKEQIREIRQRFDEVTQMALQHGEAIAICHFRPTTATLLAELLDTLEAKGIELVHASELVK